VKVKVPAVFWSRSEGVPFQVELYVSGRLELATFVTSRVRLQLGSIGFWIQHTVGTACCIRLPRRDLRVGGCSVVSKSESCDYPYADMHLTFLSPRIFLRAPYCKLLDFDGYSSSSLDFQVLAN